MLSLKRTAVAVVLSVSNFVFAGTMGPICNAGNVSVPCENTAWDIGGKAIFLQPTLPSNSVASQRYITDNTIKARAAGQNPPYIWGFFLEGSYHFNTGNDVNLNWYHVTHTTSRILSYGLTLPTAANPADIVQPAPVNVSINPKWDAVNLEFGQHVNVSEYRFVRFHAGFQYARLTANASNYSVNTENYNIVNPTYNGFGPRVGADLNYGFSNGLTLYANAASSLLAGTSKFSNYSQYITGETINTLKTSGSSPLLVPELEAKLGVNYVYTIAQGDLSFDFAWMWINYFNATQSDLIGLTPQNGDFGLTGPVFGMKWIGNFA